MLNISLTIDHNYQNLGFQDNSIRIALDLSKYAYYVFTKDLDLIYVCAQTSSLFNNGEVLNISVDPKVNLFRVPQERQENSIFWATNEPIPVDKLEFFKTNDPVYGNFCVCWKSSMRAELPEGSSLSDIYAMVYPTHPSATNKLKVKNFKGSELITNIINKLEIVERLPHLEITNINICVRSDLTPLMNSESARWVSSWEQNKVSSYLFLDGDEVVCSDLATLKRNPSFDADKVPWIVVINPSYGSVVITFNAKVYESKLSLLSSIFPNFKKVKITKEDALETLSAIAKTDNYPESVKALSEKFMSGEESLQAIIYGDDNMIFKIGRVHAKQLDNLYIQVGTQYITDPAEREKLSAEVTALLHSNTNSFHF